MNNADNIKNITKKPLILVIAGPTATGKTSLSLGIAAKIDGEIISADSMQLYKGMDIGTAKVSVEERVMIPHHLLDILLPYEEFSVAQYQNHAKMTANDIIYRRKIPIIVGGTGFYISSVMDNTEFSEMEHDDDYCNALSLEYQELGGEYLLARLSIIDPITAKRLHANDAKRIIRAFEIYHATGKTQSEWDAASKSTPSPYEFYPVLLTYSDRQALYRAIDMRVDLMMEQGLLGEAEVLYRQKIGKTARQAIGYKELFAYFDKQCSLFEAVENIKKASRHLAKRQLTWFNRDGRYKRFEVDTQGIEGIREQILKDII